MGLEKALDRELTGDRPRFDMSRNTLVGGFCRECETTVWPGRAVCHHCGGYEVADRAFASTAMLLTYTDVHVPRPGREVPYTLGQVRVDDGGPLLFGRVLGLGADVSLPSPVRIKVGTTEEGQPTYWFEPVG